MRGAPGGLLNYDVTYRPNSFSVHVRGQCPSITLDSVTCTAPSHHSSLHAASILLAGLPVPAPSPPLIKVPTNPTEPIQLPLPSPQFPPAHEPTGQGLRSFARSDPNHTRPGGLPSVRSSAERVGKSGQMLKCVRNQENAHNHSRYTNSLPKPDRRQGRLVERGMAQEP